MTDSSVPPRSRSPIRWTSSSITSLMLESSRDLVYYVHYEEHDRRLDEWVPLSRFDLETLRCVPLPDGVRSGDAAASLDVSGWESRGGGGGRGGIRSEGTQGGDASATASSYAEITLAHLILTTPEKWDSITLL